MNINEFGSPVILPAFHEQDDSRNNRFMLNMSGGTTKCHYCGNKMGKPPSVKCRHPGCTLAYCRACLVRRYRYCKKVAKRLPTAAWKCPKCTGKCTCEKYL